MLSRETPRERAADEPRVFPRIGCGVTFNAYGSPVTTARFRYDVSPDGERLWPAICGPHPVALVFGCGARGRGHRERGRAQLIEQLAVRERRRARSARHHQCTQLRGLVADGRHLVVLAHQHAWRARAWRWRRLPRFIARLATRPALQMGANRSHRARHAFPHRARSVGRHAQLLAGRRRSRGAGYGARKGRACSRHPRARWHRARRNARRRRIRRRRGVTRGRVPNEGVAGTRARSFNGRLYRLSVSFHPWVMRFVARGFVSAVLALTLSNCSSSPLDTPDESQAAPAASAVPTRVELVRLFDPPPAWTATALAFDPLRTGELWVTLRRVPSNQACLETARAGCAALQGEV